MFRFFESLVDPYAPYAATDTPPTRLWPFLRDYLRPAWKVMVWTVLAVLAVAVIEIWLIWYVGRLVDVLGDTPPAAFWARHGLELVAVAAFILLARPVIQTASAALINQSLMPNVGTIVRWRSNRHVLRQSVDWFQSDFAGRIANRMMQTAPAVGEATFQTFDAMVYAIVYLVGALWLLSDTDLRLGIPLLVWLGLYVWLVAWTIPRVGKASKAFSDARSAITGRIVDSYTNIQSVKLFAHTRTEEAYAGEAIEHARKTFMAQMRIITLMDLGLTVINGFLIVAVIGYALVLWQQGSATIGTVAAASALVLRLNAMTGWIMWSLSSLFQNLGVIREGMETITQPIRLTDAPDARRTRPEQGRDRLRPCQPPLRPEHRRAARGLADHPAGREGRPRRPLRRGQVDPGQPAAALLRHRGRRHPHRRPGHRARSRRTRCAAASAWSRRIPRSCTARCATTSSTAAPTPPRPR